MQWTDEFLLSVVTEIDPNLYIIEEDQPDRKYCRSFSHTTIGGSYQLIFFESRLVFLPSTAPYSGEAVATNERVQGHRVTLAEVASGHAKQPTPSVTTDRQ